ncbi:TetR/AcrR family transcriptional regulator [Nocardia halotolerans]|uniref:TetR/AcrR family transcriptional regulator n=1 Tax=Nocardia halotolerans TaxID=1755878 RepID=A0ABV8VNA8_9NOCA
MTQRPATIKGEATKARIVSAYAALIVSRGLAATTLDDIRAATGTSKSQLFHYFPGGKEELLMAVARFEADRAMDQMRARVPSLSSWAGWSQWREQLLGEYDRHGRDCPLGILIIEIDRASSGARALVTELTEQLQRMIQTGIENMQADGSVRADLDARRCARSLSAGIHGASALMLTTGSTAYLADVIDTAVEHLRSGIPLSADL